MSPNRSAATVPLLALSFPGIGHTCVSYPHPSPLCQNSNLWTRTDYPSKSACVDAGTAGKSESSTDLSTAPSRWISKFLVGPSQSDEQGPVARSVPPPRNRKTRILHECWLHTFPLSRRSIPDNDTSAPRLSLRTKIVS